MLAKWESMSAIAYFNSIKVQLELIAPQKNVQRRLNFNSIKVQLELALLLICGKNVAFQFHKGTIRTETRYRDSKRFGISIP